MRILIAEDDSSLRRALLSIMQKNNYTADAVDNGGDALDYIMCGSYDAAVLDIMMSVMDGVEVLRRARKAGIETPVLFLTARAEINDKITGLDAGADDYLTKPFDVSELLARLRVLTRKSGVQQTSALSFGNTTLDTSSFELGGPGGSYRLVGKEYQTMLFFMRNPGSVITSERILENIWNEVSRAGENTVWTYVSYLRRKLEALRSDITIRTMRGSGYVLEEKR